MPGDRRRRAFAAGWTPSPTSAAESSRSLHVAAVPRHPATHRLLRSGITLRRRVENRKGVWQLEAALRRRPLRAGGAGRPEPCRRAFLDLLGRACCATRELTAGREAADAARRASRVGPRRDRIEVVRGHGRRARRCAASPPRFVEVEAEVVKGDGDRLDMRRARRCARPARRPSDGAARSSPGSSRSSRRRRPRSRTAPSGRLRALLVEQYETMLANDPGVRLGKRSPRRCTSLRVATQALARPAARGTRARSPPDWAEPLRVELAWLGAGCSGRFATSTSCSSTSTPRRARSKDDDARAFRRLRRPARGQERERRPARRCSKRWRATATSSCSTSSRERPPRRQATCDERRWPRSRPASIAPPAPGRQGAAEATRPTTSSTASGSRPSGHATRPSSPRRELGKRGREASSSGRRSSRT